MVGRFSVVPSVLEMVGRSTRQCMDVGKHRIYLRENREIYKKFKVGASGRFRNCRYKASCSSAAVGRQPVKEEKHRGYTGVHGTT